MMTHEPVVAHSSRLLASPPQSAFALRATADSSSIEEERGLDAAKFESWSAVTPPVSDSRRP